MADENDTIPPPEAPTKKKKGFLSKIWKVTSSPLGLLIALIIYSFIGATLFKVIEGAHETYEKHDLIEMREEIIDSMWNSSSTFQNRAKFAALVKDELRKYESQLYSAFSQGINSESEVKKWDFWGSMVFATTIYTTIGYGHIAPATDTGRIVAMIYALIGIPLCLIVLAEFGRILTIMIKFFYSFPRRLIIKDEYAIDDEFNLPVSVALGVTLMYIFGGALMYMQWEEWDYLEAFYFIFISISTVGFGDVLPSNSEYFLLSFCYQLFGLALVAMVINVVMESLQLSISRVGKNVLESGKSIGIDLTIEEDVAEEKEKAE